MNEIQIFQNNQFGEVRIAMNENNDPLFCLSDICKLLDLQVGATKNRLDEKGISSINTLTNGGVQQLIYVSEKNLYKVIMRSEKPQAEPFQDWVTSEVLPSIRKTGSYSVQYAYQIPQSYSEALMSPNYSIIPNYSRYVIDILGNVYSMNYNKTGVPRIMKQRKNRYGYMQIQLYDDNKKCKLLSVHRLVAIAFIPIIPGKNYVNHIDGNKSNNSVHNLKWCNPSENTRHSYDIIKTQSYNRLTHMGINAAKNLRKFTQQEVEDIREKHGMHHISFRKLASYYNCGKTVIERIVNHVTYAN